MFGKRKSSDLTARIPGASACDAALALAWQTHGDAGVTTRERDLRRAAAEVERAHLAGPRRRDRGGMITAVRPVAVARDWDSAFVRHKMTHQREAARTRSARPPTRP